MQTPIVIDLSHHNVVPVSFKETAAAGIVGVIHKATEGGSMVDRKVNARYAMAKEAGLLFGLYHFIRPGSMRAQATHFVSVCNRFDKKDLLPVLDYEDKGVSVNECVEWLEMVEALTGRRPVVYSGHVLKEMLGLRRHPKLNGDHYKLWLAQYGPKAVLPAGWDDYWLWQYTETGKIAGVTPPTDLNSGDVQKVLAYWRTEQPVPVEPVEPEPPLVPTVMNFADAMQAMLVGDKVKRKGWTDALYVQYARPLGTMTRPWVAIVTKDGANVPYVATQFDMLATDWELVK